MGQGQLGRRHGEQHGHRDLDQGLAHELDDQVATAGADRFAHSDLDRPPRRLGRHQGDEVDGGDHHNQHPDGGDPRIDPAIPGGAGDLRGTDARGGEVQGGQGLHPELIAGSVRMRR